MSDTLMRRPDLDTGGEANHWGWIDPILARRRPTGRFHQDPLGTTFQQHTVNGELPPGQLADDVSPLEIVIPVRLPLASSYFESSFCRQAYIGQRRVLKYQMRSNPGR
ncbi:hypothetical protein CI238_02878 [Colletotrichum incanum]|uniref:Uncharacterized protein n=1 Tax=Colletotrichum incanum TaxID=1573173 RepID=A0A166LIE9_COLIC|nr:hypothetical protein CI238_02878 [Colletotrichum incanum]